MSTKAKEVHQELKASRFLWFCSTWLWLVKTLLATPVFRKLSQKRLRRRNSSNALQLTFLRAGFENSSLLRVC